MLSSFEGSSELNTNVKKKQKNILYIIIDGQQFNAELLSSSKAENLPRFPGISQHHSHVWREICFASLSCAEFPGR